jgi:biotin carboxylase
MAGAEAMKHRLSCRPPARATFRCADRSRRKRSHRNPEDAQALAQNMGYPVLLKASLAAAAKACALSLAMPSLPPGVMRLRKL